MVASELSIRQLLELRIDFHSCVLHTYTGLQPDENICSPDCADLVKKKKIPDCDCTLSNRAGNAVSFGSCAALYKCISLWLALALTVLGSLCFSEMLVLFSCRFECPDIQAIC